MVAQEAEGELVFLLSFGRYDNKNGEVTGLEAGVLEAAFGTILKAQGCLLLALTHLHRYLCHKF